MSIMQLLARFAFVSTAIILSLLFHAGTVLAAEARTQRPNVLFIAVDDLRDWVGYLGANPQTLTPNIDRLARRGVWFNRAYCAAPSCNPSRAALLSGLRPGTSGIYDNSENFQPAIAPDLTLPTQFRNAGYSVFGAGKIYHGSVYRAAEWDDWFRGDKDSTREEDDAIPTAVRAGKLPVTPLNCDDADMVDYKVVDYAIAQLNRVHEKPFFVACGLTKPHLPWSVPKKYYAKFPLESIQLPPYRENDLEDLPPLARQMARGFADHEAILQGGTNVWKQAIQAYLAAIHFADAMVGRLLDAYDQSPQRDNTIICFWSDHGWHLGEKHHWRKFALWEESTRAPLIWVVPGLTKPDGRSDQPVDFMSIYPTLTDLCGIPTPAHVQGRSLRPLLTDPKATWDAPAITTYRRNNHSIRTANWRYTRYADGTEELYDKQRDPHEWDNLLWKQTNAPGKAELAKFLPTENNPPAKSNPGNRRVRANRANATQP